MLLLFTIYNNFKAIVVQVTCYFINAMKMLLLFTIYNNFKAIVVQGQRTVISCSRVGSVTYRSVTQRL